MTSIFGAMGFPELRLFHSSWLLTTLKFICQYIPLALHRYNNDNRCYWRNHDAVLIHDEAENRPWRKTDWVLVAKNRQMLQQPAIRDLASPITPIPSLGVWTDDFNNLFQVIK
jgi:hypothetical protein